ncbi:MAG: hypothetical protein E7585_05110 [Ruminococcaceae bacterium]|nr:hypothetical protein [Oscillospiraceae bacterium]
MFAYPSADRVGSVDGTDAFFPESLYLLDRNFVIIGMRPATERTGPEPALGDRFFDHFPATKEESAILKKMMTCANENSLLMWAGNRPILVICAYYPVSQMLLVAVPERRVRLYLDRPAAYDGRVGLDEILIFSTAALSRNAPLTTDGYNMLSNWFGRLHMPFFYSAILEKEYDAPVAVLAVRLMELAKLCGCRVSFDFHEMGYSYQDLYPFELAIPTLLAVFLAVYRIGKNREVTIRGWHYADTGPMCSANFWVEDLNDALPEYSALRQLAEQKNRIFADVRNPEQPESRFCEFMTCVPDFADQGLRTGQLYKDRAKSDWQIFLLPGASSFDKAIHKHVIENLDVREIPKTEQCEKEQKEVK